MVDSYATNVHQPLPLSITVRNVFPPLALSDNTSTSPKQGNADNLIKDDGASESEDKNKYYEEGRSNDNGAQLLQQQGQSSDRTATSMIIQRKIKVLSTKVSSSSVEERCALVSKEVLLRLRLDIIIITKKHDSIPSNADTTNNTSNSKNKIEEEEETLIYSSEQSSSTLHPRWDHVDERLESILNHYDSKEDEDDDDTSKTTAADAYARFVILPSDNEINDGNNSSSLSTTTSAEQPQESSSPAAAATTQDNNEWILAEIPLHPSKLRRLPSTTQQFTSSNDEAAQSNTQSSNNSSNSSMIVPSTLPPNTILLHYNDGYTRVLPTTYWILVQRGYINESSVVDPIIKRYGSGGSGYIKSLIDESKDKMDDGGGGEGTVFEDKTFNLLGKESVNDEEGGRSSNDDDCQKDNTPADNVLGDAATTDNSMTTNCDTLHQESKGTTQPSLLPSTMTNGQELNNASDLLLVDKSSQEDVSSNVPEEEEGGGTNEITDSSCTENDDEQPTTLNSEVVVNDDEQMMHESISPKLPHLPTASIIQAEDCETTKTRNNEIDELKRLVQLEQHLLEEEQRCIDQRTNHLRSIMHEVKLLENETVEIMNAVGVERANIFKSEFRLKVHQIHLLQHLQSIFPIKLVPINISVNPPNFPQHQYTIANLPLPDDIHNPTATDDQVSTALGLVCHLVSLTSKYLCIPLRYTLVCKFSRSAVLFDHSRDLRANTNNSGGGGGGANKTAGSRVVYPLFRERGVIDREQLDYGLMLLERDVNCLLRTRNVPFRSEWNVLAKMEKLLMHVVEGDDPSFGDAA